jgi:transposase
MTTASFPIELNIADVEIKRVSMNRNGEYEIRAKSTINGCSCRKCNQPITKFYAYDREIRLQHLSILGMKTYIIIKLPRYRCFDCYGMPTTTQQVPWRIRKSPHTIDYEMHVISELIGSTVEEISIKEDIGYEAIMGIIRRHVESEVNWDNFDEIEILGLDEISLKKGHKDFVTIVSTRIDGNVFVLAILDGRKKSTVKKFLKSIPDRIKKTVKFVCSDLYDGFINAAKEVFTKRTKIIIDRFHVAKLYGKGFDDIRKKELKRLKEELSDEEYKKLNGAMWVLRKNRLKLDKKDNNLLNNIFKHSTSLEIAYKLRNKLTDTFNTYTSRSGGKRRINNWINKVKESSVNCYDKFIKTLEANLEEVVNYFINRDSSGFVEGLNNKIKVIKRRCYGILNAKHLFQRVFLDFSGHDFFNFNQ